MDSTNDGIRIKDGRVIWTLSPKDAEELSYALQKVGWGTDSRHLFEASQAATKDLLGDCDE